MLKYKLKQWLIKHEPEACKVEPGSSPWSTTPPLKRTPSMSAVNQYPSLKTKVLGPKMVEPTSPSEDSSKGERTTRRREGRVFLRLRVHVQPRRRASFATGLPCGKRKADDVPFKKPSSPVKTVRVVESEEPESRPTSPKPAPSRSKPPTPKPSKRNHPLNRSRPRLRRPVLLGVATRGRMRTVEETDEDIARRLHQEFNCAPMRTSRARGAKPCAQEVAEDSVHGQDPGILPSC